MYSNLLRMIKQNELFGNYRVLLGVLLVKTEAIEVTSHDVGNVSPYKATASAPIYP